MAAKRPNIVMIIGDDGGWVTVGAYHQGIMGTTRRPISIGLPARVPA